MTSAISEKITDKVAVLKYTQILCNALEHDFIVYSMKMHNRSIESGQDVEYHQQKLDDIAEGNYDGMYKYTIEEGKKYLKITMNRDDNGRSVHAFVNKESGEVYKPKSWFAPAPHVRFNLLDEQSREECLKRADWAGSYLYM